MVYAYGHLFAQQAKLVGVYAPMHEGKLNRDQLAQMMLVADFVGLERAGALSLSLSTSKVLFIGTESVRVTKLKDVQAGPVSRAILGQLTGDPNKDGAKNVVYRLLRKDSVDPFGVVVSWSQQSLLQNVYYHEEEGGRIAQMVAGSRKVPDRERLATLEESAGQQADAAATLARLNYIYPVKDEELHRRLGDLLYGQKQYDGAIREYVAVVASHPIDKAGAEFHLAQAYLAAGQKDKAQESVLAALEAAPGYRPAQKMLLELNQSQK